MIAPLRRRHRGMVLVLLLLVPALAITALLQRPAAESGEALPAILAGRDPGDRPPAVDRGDLFPGRAVGVRQWRHGVLAVIEIEPLEPLAKPDVLAYWSMEAPEAEELPKNAFLLGPVAEGKAGVFPLPRAALRVSGHLILYSLGHGEVVARAELPESEVQGGAEESQ